MTDIPVSDGTAAWLRILADQMEKGEAPDFFLVTSIGDGNVDYTWRTLNNSLALLGAVEVKTFELKTELQDSRISR